MNAPLEALRSLVSEALVASLGVMEDGVPAVSLVGFTAAFEPARFHLLVSELSSHTPALRSDPRCSLLVHALPSPDDPKSNHALVRLMVKGRATFLSREEAERGGVTTRWRARYPIADTLLGLSDFQFVEIVPSEGTFVQGFGRAYRVTGTNLDELTHVGR
ncbi:MAG: pyridoxamine 5'-phosphate oxidase [Polyangiaceae bacterium]|nr:pyridoxamine 5'-phosphate oxidase [Polyangiaceae bacterium]